MAARCVKDRPDSNMMDFYPMDHETGDNDYDSSTLRYMKMNDVWSQGRQTAFEDRVKEWLRGYIMKKYSKETIVMCIAPGHKAFDKSSFMYSLVGQFIAKNHDLRLEDGRDLLERYKTIEKQTNVGSNRNEQTHRDSIRINGDEEDNSDEEDFSEVNKGKIVIILDDVWTTGCTLRVCEEKVRTTGPKDVKILAIGKTVQRM